jgi:flavin-dependent dehydrogenase
MDYDVIIIGGSISGAATATMLKNRAPALRVLVLEKSTHFTRRIGEATVEISGYFLCRVLGLTTFLNETQLVKQGMRFWFANDRTTSLGDASEIGPRYLVRLPSFQVDRAVLDEEILRRAVEKGVELLRPAGVTDVELHDGGEQVVTVKDGDASRVLRCRWVVDASGVACTLARKNGWWQTNDAHPTTSVWARWRGVKDMDGMELAQKHPAWAAATYGMRGTATNHVIGDGWWSWWIPLKGGDTSVGIVFDQRHVQWPQDERPVGERLKDFLMKNPVARELIADAEWIEGDVHLRKNLSYKCDRLAGDGFALVGDASGFLDPFYSPGMDWVSFTTSATAALIAKERAGEPITPLVAEHNRAFLQSYRRWFESVYCDKYEYLGDYELMRLAFQLDLGLYYMGIVSQPFKFGADALTSPPFARVVSTPFYHLMRTYNRRMASIARVRRARGQHGRGNTGGQFMFPGFTFEPSDALKILRLIGQWLRLELREGWRSWFAPAGMREDRAPAATSEEIR